MTPRKDATTESRPILLGVCASLAERFGLELTLLRLAFVLLGLTHGLGILAYALMLLAGQSSVLRVQRTSRGRRSIGQLRAEVLGSSNHGRLGAAAALMGIGALVLFWSLGLFEWLTPARGFGLGALALGGSALAPHLVTRGESHDA